MKWWFIHMTKCDYTGCIGKAIKICHFDGEENRYVCFIHRHQMLEYGKEMHIPLREQPIGLHMMRKET